MHISLALVSAVAAGMVAAGGAPGVAQAAPGGQAVAAHSSTVGWKRCTNPHLRFSIGYPRHWYTAQPRPADRCRQFDRRPFTVPPNSEYPITALNAAPTSSTVRAYIASATDPVFAVTRLVRKTRVEGRSAVRFETVATGEGLYPKGTRTYGYAINRNGSAFVVFTMTLPGDRRYGSNKVIVDRAVHTLRFR
jgi:hypothetical protein